MARITHLLSIIGINPDESHKAKIFIYIIIVSILSVSFFWLFDMLSVHDTGFPYAIAAIIYSGILLLFKITKSLFYTINFYVATLFVFFAYLSLESGGLYSHYNFFICTLPLSALVLSKMRTAIVWYGIIISWFICLYYIMNYIPGYQHFKSDILYLTPGYSLVILFLQAMIMMAIIVIFTAVNKKFLYRIKKDQLLLEKKNEQYALLNQELISFQERLEMSNKELQQYAYTTSHDLKQPIRTINSFAGLLNLHLSANDSLDPTSKEYLDLISCNSKNMHNLITESLNYARLTAHGDIPKKLVNLDTVLSNVVKNLKNQIDSNGVSLTIKQLPEAMVIPTKIGQVFQNIISNSIKFKDNSRQLKISVFSEKLPDEYRISIQDNGIGIPTESHEKIFLPFEKSDQDSGYPGCGIGLATCKKIVEMHRGKLSVKSILGQGSIFSFTIPHH